LLEQLSQGLARAYSLCLPGRGEPQGRVLVFANDRVTEAESLAGQCRATRDRFAATEGPLLVVHDTTELSYRREDGRPARSVSRTLGRMPWADRVSRPYAAS
jgi:hypothetical protein